jgi:hypothetical protein
MSKRDETGKGHVLFVIPVAGGFAFEIADSHRNHPDPFFAPVRVPFLEQPLRNGTRARDSARMLLRGKAFARQYGFTNKAVLGLDDDGVRRDQVPGGQLDDIARNNHLNRSRLKFSITEDLRVRSNARANRLGRSFSAVLSIHSAHILQGVEMSQPKTGHFRLEAVLPSLSERVSLEALVPIRNSCST